MLEAIDQFLATAVGYVWNIPLVVVLIGSGLLFTFLLKGVQFTAFRHAIDIVRGKFDKKSDPGEITHFKALTTALSATIGLGNIAGVAVAINMGGPGACFWMMVAGLVGMVTKFCECSLAVKYRKVDSNGKVRGGPMYYIQMGLGDKFKPLAIFFALACMIATFGAGNMFQTNQVAKVLNSYFDIPVILTGLVLATATGLVIIGGIKRISNVTGFLVPFMGIIYMGGSLLIIGLNASEIPTVVGMIFEGAFSGTAAAGGFAGVAVAEVLKQGVRRACFSNEAGLGSAPIAHAAASTKEPIREGIVATIGPFVDTVVICMMTASVILLSGAWPADAGIDGVELTAMAFDMSLPGFGKFFVPIAVTLFGYSTLISWAYYGEMATDYLFKENKTVMMIYKLVFCIFAFTGALWALGPVLNFSDIMLGLMVVPNIIGVWLLFPKIKAETKSYFDRLKKGEFDKPN